MDAFVEWLKAYVAGLEAGSVGEWVGVIITGLVALGGLIVFLWRIGVWVYHRVRGDDAQARKIIPRMEHRRDDTLLTVENNSDQHILDVQIWIHRRAWRLAWARLTRDRDQFGFYNYHLGYRLEMWEDNSGNNEFQRNRVPAGAVDNWPASRGIGGKFVAELVFIDVNDIRWSRMFGSKRLKRIRSHKKQPFIRIH